MRPDLSLDIAVVRQNARAWRDFAGVPLRAVVKGDGYGWGFGRLIHACEGIAEAFCVSDADELRAVRRYTDAPVIILGSVEPDRLAEVLQSNAMPSISSVTELAIARDVLEQAGRPFRVRVGLRPAAAWSGLSLREWATFAPALAQAGAEVELWTHITDWNAREEQGQNFHEALRTAEAAGVRLVGNDIASTMPAAAGGAQGTSVRIGVGLFGATGGAAVPGVACALSVIAPVVRIERHSPGTRVGYGGTMLRMAESIATARCGYADGLPKTIAGADDILSVGMQYVTARASRLDSTASELVLLDRSSNLDAFAAQCGRLPHEIVTAFGNCARANGVSVEV
jgi:alanine racemase